MRDPGCVCYSEYRKRHRKLAVLSLVRVGDEVNQRYIRCVTLHAAPGAPTAGCLEAENVIGCFKSAGLQAPEGDAGAA